MAEAVLGGLQLETDQLEDAFLQRPIVNSDAPAGGLPTIEHEIVLLAAGAARVAGQQWHILRHRSCEEVVAGIPATFLLVPLH